MAADIHVVDCEKAVLSVQFRLLIKGRKGRPTSKCLHVYGEGINDLDGIVERVRVALTTEKPGSASAA